MCFWTNGYPQDSAGKHTMCLTHVGISTWVFFSSHPGSRHGDARNEHCTVTALWVIGILIMTHSVKQIHEHELRWSRTSLWKRLVTGFLWVFHPQIPGFPSHLLCGQVCHWEDCERLPQWSLEPNPNCCVEILMQIKGSINGLFPSNSQV
jgi:hypothetical protein